MIRGIYTAISGLITGEAKQSVINNNIANANTNGFKSETLVTKKFSDVLIKNYDKVIGDKNVKNDIGSLCLGNEIDEVVTNYTRGIIQDTDSDTDFAIDGKGFFSLIRYDGINKKELYTRDGHFHINTQGFLVDDCGDKVIGYDAKNGNEVPIFVGSNHVKLNQAGDIFIGDELKYKFRIVDFKDTKRVKKEGDNYYTCDSVAHIKDANILQKHLERSNVNVTNEMVNMMAVMRGFESNQTVLKTLDETLSKSVNEIGRVR
ncbi:flagellar basal-body rod protein FlgG [Clostridium tepidiprofundi DSM 19306]|uniref:Flagellar basal-body rod protein FlgG n=1 Tax=Clostridium tepidiprofundi DSM 19306 TaxID=1121338 RepID=A0A151B7A5_9CLOT|nr:flagellar hook-basal body complex protein [Clostridium tepidiprofundi]KYH35622.1 flagellar basal-body rod protein FlgG [Clostridium tepidiprofundi DSM 19306]